MRNDFVTRANQKAIDFIERRISDFHNGNSQNKTPEYLERLEENLREAKERRKDLLSQPNCENENEGAE